MSKKHAYDYEAGYRDGSINYELEHCPACKNVADLQEALAENGKLREMLAEDNEELAKMRRFIDYLYSFAKACGVDAGDMHELGVDVN